MPEIWRKISGFEDYAVSNHGRVRSLKREIIRVFSDGKEVAQTIQEKELKPATNPKTKYQHVSLRKNGKSFSVHVHALVAKEFIPGFASGLEVCHKDGNRSHNYADNLRWDTRKGNLADTLQHGTRLQGESQNGAKLTEQDVLAIRQERADGEKWADIAERHGVSIMTAHCAGTGKTWKHI